MLECNSFIVINKIEREYKEFQRKANIKYGGSNLNFLGNRQVVFQAPNTMVKLYKTKVDYIESRFGFKLTEEDISRYKMIFSIKDFIKNNKLDAILNSNKNNQSFMNNINKLENYGVGFLSADKSTIIFRSIDKDKTGYRYNNFTLFPELESKKTYTIANNCLDLKNTVFDIYMTEGAFDIIGVHKHLYNSEMNTNSIFIANAGKSYLVTGNYIKKLSILNANINIYSDKDVDVDFYKDLMKSDPFFGLNGINLYYNNAGKDFGVTKDEIKLSRKIELY